MNCPNLNLIICAIICFTSDSSFAGREIFLPPIQMITESGGTLAQSAGIQRYCMSTGLNQLNTTGLYGPPFEGLNGVCGAWQKLRVVLTNLQDKPQSVTLTALPGTTVTSLNSNGSAMEGSFNQGPTISITNSEIIETVSIPGKGFTMITVFVMCSSKSCEFSSGSGTAGYPMSGPNLFAGTKIAVNPCGDPPQVCISQFLNFLLKLTVTENYGSLVGSVSFDWGNNGGRNTVVRSSPGTLLITSGKAF